MIQLKSDLLSRQNELDFLQNSNNQLRGDLFERTKVHIDMDGLVSQNNYLLNANDGLKKHLEDVCNQLESVLGENDRLNTKLKQSDPHDTTQQNKLLIQKIEELSKYQENIENQMSDLQQEIDDKNKNNNQLEDILKGKNEEIKILKKKEQEEKTSMLNTNKSASNMYASQAVGGRDVQSQIQLLKRKNDILKTENDLIRKELKALKELKKKDLNSSKVNINNNENEIANLTREIGKLERFKKDVRKIKSKDFLCSKFN